MDAMVFSSDVISFWIDSESILILQAI